MLYSYYIGDSMLFYVYNLSSILIRTLKACFFFLASDDDVQENYSECPTIYAYPGANCGGRTIEKICEKGGYTS